MSPQKTASPQPAEELPPDDRSLGERMRQWVLEDSPSWLASMLIHMFILVLVGIFFGRAIIKEMVGDAPTFETGKTEVSGEEEIQRFDIGDAPLDPTELTAESLAMKDPPGQAQQEAAFYDENPVFEDRGGGSAAGLETGAGGLGFNVKAEGLGPVLGGGGGADLGKGEGTGFGKGGSGEGFGGRGQGHRDALLGRYGGTKQTERAVAGALNWLARHQNANGSWSVGRFKTHCKDGTCTGAGNVDADTGGTALGLLPFLAAGQTHLSRGPYKKQISKAVQWLIQTQRPNGDLSNGQQHQMYEHGLASIALCEAYGMSGDSRVGKAARLAVQFIQTGQNAEGGWRYTHGTNESDTSVFAWQMMALKSATMAGISVDQAKLELGRKWLNTVSEGERNAASLGRFAYQRNTPVTPCMSAAALLIVQYTGANKTDPTLLGGVKYLMANPPTKDDRDTYYWYYATQTMHNMCGPDWDTWNRQMRRILVETQNKTGCATGSWDPDKPTADKWGMSGGRLMLTSLSALTLEVYYRYLPLYKVDAEVGARGKKAPAAKEAAPAGSEEKKAAKDAAEKKPGKDE